MGSGDSDSGDSVLDAKKKKNKKKSKGDDIGPELPKGLVKSIVQETNKEISDTTAPSSSSDKKTDTKKPIEKKPKTPKPAPVQDPITGKRKYRRFDKNGREIFTDSTGHTYQVDDKGYKMDQQDSDESDLDPEDIN